MFFRASFVLKWCYICAVLVPPPEHTTHQLWAYNYKKPVFSHPSRTTSLKGNVTKLKNRHILIWYNTHMSLIRSIIVVTLLALLLATATIASASGTPLTTTQTNKGGQVQTYSKNGVMYLTTETAEAPLNTVVITEASPSATPTISKNGTFSLIRQDISMPRGFAKDFGSWLNSVLSLVMVISALLVFFFLISGAFDWITSGGDKGKTEKARGKIIAAVIGLIIVAASYAVLTLVVRFLGFNNLNDVLESAKTIKG